MAVDERVRCFGNKLGQEFYADYHDYEWCIPSHDDDYLLEMLILEGAQAGLSWEIILRKREGYRRAFHSFEPARVAAMTDVELEELRHDPGIIRNRSKIRAARTNAQIFLTLQDEHQSFANFLWGFVGGEPIVNHWKVWADVPAATDLSSEISKQLRQRGMAFVGPTIIYSYMQAVGLVNDHVEGCWRYGQH